MTSLADALRDPIALPANRIARFYRGGPMLDTFRGLGGVDDGRPEDWVGSATATWASAGDEGDRTGVSTVSVAGRTIGLDELLREEPEALVGAPFLERAGPTLGLLVKLLDAGERLPVHCHPTRAAASDLLDSAFGKTEAWIILGTRDGPPAPRVWAGLREAVAPSTLQGWIDSGDTGAMLGALAEYDVEPGDAILVPGGVPHAIGSGVFLLELQEPTDFSVVAETRGFPISDADATLGLGWERAIGFFRTDAPGDLRQTPGPPAEHDGLRLTPLLGPAADPYFRALRLDVDGRASAPLPVESSFAVGVVLDGVGTITGAASSLPLARGATFAIPAAAIPDVRIGSDGPLELILCLPPDPAALREAT